MPKYEDMKPHGIVPHTRAYKNPLQRLTKESTDARATNSASKEHKDPSTSDSEVSSETNPMDVSHVHVERIMLDQEHVILYKNSVGVFYCTSLSAMHTFPLKNVINVYHDENGNTIALEDDCKNQYRIVQF